MEPRKMRRCTTNTIRLGTATLGLLVMAGCSSLKITLEIDPDFPTFTVDDQVDEKDSSNDDVHT